ncbi:MAG TPA: M15 family metallopeptidase [Kofleriaceae bacterium]
MAVQIAREVDCTWPTSLVKFSPTSKMTFTSSAVLPFLHGSAKSDLTAVAQNNPLRVNSGYRTVVQQYLVYRWNRTGRCGIAAAALPGNSNHESGRAVDLANWSTRVGAMASHHWSHSVPGDPVHFDHFGSPDNRGKDVRAFQRLWNRNHPGDTIAVDGAYGPQTAARLKASPATGFSKGPLCAAALVAEGTVPELDVLAIDGPDLVAPSERVHYVMTIANPTGADWPETAQLVVADGAASPLYDDATWTSPSEIGAIGVAVPAQGSAQLDLDITTPAVTEPTPLAVDLAIVDGTTQLGTFQLALTVTPNGDAGMSGEIGTGDEDDGGVPADEDGVVSDDGGGCSSTRPSSAFLALALLGLLASRRKRR